MKQNSSDIEIDKQQRYFIIQKQDTLFTCIFEGATSNRTELSYNMTQCFVLLSNAIYSLMTSKTLTTHGPWHNHGLTTLFIN